MSAKIVAANRVDPPLGSAPRKRQFGYARPMIDDAAILAIDQGTTSSRAIVFRPDGAIAALAQREFRQIYPANGWVEHDPEEIWQSVLAVAREALTAAEAKGLAVRGIGITNQRETTLVWERATGRPIHNAIVWQDRRTAEACARLRADGHDADIAARTGLVVDPYFSATKIAWLLDNVPGARGRAAAGALVFGTVDTFLLWRLTGGRVHATDVTNASRTSLYNIHDLDWDDAMLRLFGVPRVLLPAVQDCAGLFGETDAALFGRSLPILAIAGDQQAAAIGQACLAPGTLKSTYGTGCFMLLNTGETPVASRHRLLTTIAARIAGRTTYALEGSIFVSGAAVQWLRDGLGLIADAGETQGMAAGLAGNGGNGGVYMVPAFTGLGAPHWDPEARGAIYGLTRDTGPRQFARAALESVAYQTRDLLRAMAEDGGRPLDLRVDGGMTANDWLMQFLADVLDLPVSRPDVTETTAFGAAALAALADGIYASLDDIAAHWRLNRRFTPRMSGSERAALLAGWDDAVARTTLRTPWRTQ
jgi:glycerol kinase